MESSIRDPIIDALEELRKEVRELRLQNQGRRDADIVNARLAAIVDSSDDAIVSKTLEGIVTTWNNGAVRIFGYRPEEIIGKPINILIPANRQEEEPRILERLARGERVDHFATQRMTKDGRLIDVSLTISPVRNGQGQIVGASKIARDITEQRQHENELKAAKDAAEQANSAKDHLLAVLSHELRTPLMPLMTTLSLIEKGMVSGPELVQEAASMRRHLQLECQLIDDLLDHTRISRGKIQLARNIVDAHQLVQAVLKMCDSEFTQKHLQIEVDLQAQAQFVLADGRRLQQVLWNLMKNAVKFTPKGGRIIIRSFNGGPDGELLHISVTDTGIGIASDAIQRIFNPFEQENQMITRRFGGLGLGLAISKSFMELHHGRLDVSSPGRGKGATFTLTLPEATMAAPVAPLHQSPQPGSGVRARILLVEDHEETRRLMSRLLGSYGHEVRVAENVAVAIEDLKGNGYDVIISDIGLPDGSGLDVIKYAREQAQARGHGPGSVRGIAVSGFGSEDDERLSRNAGFDAHLVKPIDIERLDHTIRQVLQRSRVQGGAGVAAGPHV
jgi:PAS domain S-box-containing protein